MKILTGPSTVQISGKLGRSTRGSRPTGRPACFANIWIDCTDGSIYLGFTEGQLYRYLPESVDTGRGIIDALNHGLTFNQVYRLFGVFGYIANYERVSSVPGTATLAYSNPPYPGTDPGPCPSNIFDNTLWTNLVLGTGAAAYTITPATGVMQDNADVDVTATTNTQPAQVSNIGTLTYTGPGGPAAVTWSIIISGWSTHAGGAGWTLLQGGSAIAGEAFTANGTFTGTDNPVLAAGVGANQSLQLELTVDVGAANLGTLQAEVSLTAVRDE